MAERAEGKEKGYKVCRWEGKGKGGKKGAWEGGRFGYSISPQSRMDSVTIICFVTQFIKFRGDTITEPLPFHSHAPFSPPWLGYSIFSSAG